MTDRDASSEVARVWSATTIGIEAIPVELEVHVRTGLPSYTVVGLPQASVRESRDRVLSALRVTGLPVPRGAVTVNLAPADVRKDGALFDLPLAIGMLAAQSVIPVQGMLEDTLVIGELALDGRIRAVRGTLAIAAAAVRHGMRAVVVPSGSAAEASLVREITVFAVENLAQAAEVFRGRSTGVEWTVKPQCERPDTPDLCDVVGQADARRALEIAAAGRHNLLMVGPPGAGKTMLARRLPSILPPLSQDEALEVTRIRSIAGLLHEGEGLSRMRPFRSPHHTVSTAGLVGGGDPPRPGELSLAHHGVLFLDELPEFGRTTLETLRQPLEDGSLVLARARWKIRLPSRFMLVASMNPCPCGRLGVPGQDCLCDPGQVRRYEGRISGPLLDRVDLQVAVAPVRADDWDHAGGEASARVAARIAAADQHRVHRGQPSPNGDLDAAGIRRWCDLRSEAALVLRQAMAHELLSARALSRIRAVSRTIADLDGHEYIGARHVSEAIQFRTGRR